MKEVYGPVTAFVITTIVTIVVQGIKKAAPELSDRQRQAVALGVSVLAVVPYEILSVWPDLAPIDIYNAFIYAVLVWFTAMGLYKAAQVQIGSGR